MTPSTVPGATETVARSLRAAVRGDVLVTTDPGFDDARRIWNGAVDRRPALVVRCTGADDVAAAVRIAREYDVPLSVRGGGHDWAGRSLRDGGLVLDLTGMRQVTVDAAARTAEAQGGARAVDLVTAGHGHGLVPVTGTVNVVGVTGLTLAGGYGLLNGRHGLALDNLLAARVVLADGSQVTADATENPDLFWALRGGGGNFGVVTDARFRVHHIPSLLSGLMLFPMTGAAAVLRGLRELIAGADDELTVMSGFFCGPDGQPLLFLLPAWSGDPARGEPVMDRLRGLGEAITADLGPMAYRDILNMLDATVVDGRHNEVRTRWLPELTGPTIELLVSAVQRITSPYSGLFLHHFHGAAARVPVADTAFALRRDHLLVEIVSAWEPSGAGDAADHRRWARELSDELGPYALPGGYPNLLGADEPDRVLPSYGPNATRLLEVKRRFDPDNVFTAVPTLPHSAG